MKEMVGGCCVCSDERGWPDNALVYCDGNGCTVAVHQACYGIVTVPLGPWYCRKCEITDRTQKVCSLCPSRSGALKRADTGGWAHVVCALYIPEVRFGNVTSMEPIILQLIPPERYNKACYICQEAGKLRRAAAGACMQCNKSGCKQQFHVTCAQGLGLLCEEAGNYLDNVKYCGYCQHHYGKLKKGTNNVKTPYKPVHDDSQSSDSDGEGEEDASSPGPTPAPAPAPADNLPPTRKSRKSSNSTITSAKTTPSTSRASSAAPAAPLPGPSTSTQSSPRPHKSKVHHSGEKSGKKSSPVGESSRRSSVASEPSPAREPAAPAADAQHSLAHDLVAAPSTSKGASSHSLSSEQTSPNVSVAGEAAVVTISLSGDTTPTYSVEAPPLPATAPPTVISSTEYLENKHTKKRKAASQSQATPPAAGYSPPPPVAAAAPLLNPPAQYTEVPMEIDATDKVKKAKTDSPVIVSPVMHQRSPSQIESPGHRSRTSSASSLAHIRSPSRAPGGKTGGGGGGRGGSGEREAPPPPSLLVSVPLPSTSHDLSFVAPAQVAGTSTDTAPTAHNFYQLQKQAQAQAAHTQAAAAAAASTSRLSWGGLSVYEMQQQELAALNKTAEKRPEAPPMPAPVRNKKRAAMNSAALAHANTATPAIQLSPGALVSNALMMPPLPLLPPPPPPPLQHYQESPSNSPGAERSRPISAEQQLRINAANTLAPHMLGNEINLNSSAAECLSEQLSAELAAHVVGPRPPSPPLLPPPMLSRHLAGARSSASASSGGTQTLEQLLERQWEQGSQYIMERAKNFDIASLLSCLHQLRTENVRLEEQVGTLMQRKETLLAVNARLANPLSAGTAPSPESGRCSRDNSRPPSAMRTETMSADRSPQIMMQQKPS